MKRLLPVILFTVAFFHPVSVRSQTILFTNDHVMKYFPAFNEPAADWYLPGFDDSAWGSDTAIIGFGDAFSYVDFPQKPASLYFRFRFQITNRSLVKSLNFSPDYDDGFVAYLNGVEIARVNVDTGILFPAYNDLATRSHDNELITGTTNTVPGIFLDSALLAGILVEGENVMAVHVLNDSLNGSDMIFMPLLADVSYINYDFYQLFHRFKRLTDIDSTKYPLVIINTDEYGIPAFRDQRVKAHMTITDNGTGNYNKPSDAFNVYDGDISIELRGQSSRDFPKQSYRFELWDPAGTDTAVALLGMPKESDWILFGPFADRSQIRNKFIYDLGETLGSYQPRTRFCELVLNGQPVGLYNLMETIKRDSNRVNISKLKDSDIWGMDVTGGYILKYDKNDANENKITGERRLVYPKKDEIRTEQLAYIDQFFRRYDSILNGNIFFDPVNGFRKVADVSSLIDYIILNEIAKNPDAYLFSSYFYKDRDDKDGRVKFGPLWDFDLAFGNSYFQDGNLTYNWQFDYRSNQQFKIRRIFQDTSIVNAFRARWHQLRQDTLSDAALFATIDDMVGYIQDGADRNYYIWPIIDKIPWKNAGQYAVSSYQEEIATLKSYIAARTEWIDDNIDGLYYPPVYISGLEPDKTGTFTCSMYPNPFSSELYLEVSSENGGRIKIELFDITGQMKYVKEVNLSDGYNDVALDENRISSLPSGVFIVRVFRDDVLVSSQKVIKK